MLEKLQQFYKMHGRPPVKREIPDREKIIWKYGSWNAALIAAGIPVNRKFAHTEKELLESLHRFFKEFNRSPKVSDCNKTVYLFDLRTYLKKLGCKSWAEVLKKADLNPYFEMSDHRKNSDQQILEVVKSFILKHSNSTAKFYVENHGSLPSLSFLCNRFNNWTNLLRLIDITPNINAYSNEELIGLYFEAKNDLEQTPFSTQLERYTGISARMWTLRFGPYNQFLKDIGEIPAFSSPSIVHESTDELKKHYIRFSIKHGYENGAPSRVLNSSSEISNADVFTVRFGSINKLRISCGFTPVCNSNRKYSEEEIIHFLTEMWNKYKRIPGKKEIQAQPGAPSISSILRYTNSTGLTKAFNKIIKNS